MSLFWRAFHVGRGDPCIAPTGAVADFFTAFVTGNLTAIHALKPPSLGGCLLHKADQIPAIRQLHDLPAAAGASLPVGTFDECFLACHDSGSFF
jgi:hypothetical protein